MKPILGLGPATVRELACQRGWQALDGCVRCFLGRHRSAATGKDGFRACLMNGGGDTPCHGQARGSGRGSYVALEASNRTGSTKQVAEGLHDAAAPRKEVMQHKSVCKGGSQAQASQFCGTVQYSTVPVQVQCLALQGSLAPAAQPSLGAHPPGPLDPAWAGLGGGEEGRALGGWCRVRGAQPLRRSRAHPPTCVLDQGKI